MSFELAEKGVPNFWLHALVNHELLDAEVKIQYAGACTICFNLFVQITYIFSTLSQSD